MINGQEHIQYEVINVDAVQHPPEIWNTLIFPTVSNHDAELN